MLIIGNAFALTSYWGLSDDRLVRQLLPAAVAGIVFGTFLLHGLPANGLRLSLAGFSLLIVTYRFVATTVIFFAIMNFLKLPDLFLTELINAPLLATYW